MVLRRLVALSSVFAVATSCLLVTHVDDGNFGAGNGVPGDATVEDTSSSDARDVSAADAPDGPDFDAGCPDGRGPAAVRVGSYCVDSTEVTVSQYQEFVSANVDPKTQDPECLFNTDFTPGKQNSPPNNAITYVSWCDAKAYCRWAGKHLCGKVGGGSLQLSAATTNQGEWWNACSRGGERIYPYGNTYEPTTCNGKDALVAGIVGVGTFKACGGGYSGLFDMSGNAAEWIDACGSISTGDAGRRDACATLGGSVAMTTDWLKCNNGGTFLAPREVKTDSDIGFRCCR